MGHAVGDHDDAVGRDGLGPRGGNLAVQQARVHAHVRDLDVTVAQDRALGDGALAGDGSGCDGLSGGDALRLGDDTALGLGENLLGDVGRGLCAHAGAVGGDEHGQVQSGDRHPVLVTLLVQQQGDLVPGRAALQVDQEQDLVLVAEATYGLEELSPEVIRPHLGHKRHGDDVVLLAKNHLAGHLDALGERAMTG